MDFEDSEGNKLALAGGVEARQWGEEQKGRLRSRGSAMGCYLYNLWEAWEPHGPSVEGGPQT